MLSESDSAERRAWRDDLVVALRDGVIGGAAYQFAVQNPIGELAPYTACGLIGSVAYALAAHRSELYREPLRDRAGEPFVMRQRVV